MLSFPGSSEREADDMALIVRRRTSTPHGCRSLLHDEASVKLMTSRPARDEELESGTEPLYSLMETSESAKAGTLVRLGAISSHRLQP